MNFYATGIDVSHWQGTLDFKKVKASGRNFVIVKLTNGLTTDAQAASNIKNAKAAGLDVGVYHFINALNVTQAREQADYFIKTVKQFLPLSYPVALDIEEFTVNGKPYYGSRGITSAQIRAIAQAWISAVLAAGFYVVLYTNKDWALNVLEIKKRPQEWGRVGIWYARYTGNAGVVDDVGELGRVAGIIQYSSTASVSGVSGNVDVDAAKYNYPAIIKAQGQNGYTKPPVIKSDTSGVLKMTKNGVYQLKTNGPEGVKVVSGNSAVAIVIPRKHREGDADYWFIVAVGDVGSECGIYVSGPGVDSFRAFIVRVVGK